MRARQLPARSIPTLWLMTDERMGAALWPALARLPPGSGVVFRHKRTPAAERRALYDRVRRIARVRRLVLLLAGSTRQAIGWQADGVHGAATGRLPRGRLRTLPAHDRIELIAARRARADAAFLSPVFATRSHPGAPALGPLRFGLLARGASIPVIALGGITSARARRVVGLGAAGWAAIDGLARDQKRKAVPI
ncbi:thiamine phosphate synthase [Sphingomonas sp. 1P06PA]|uniref:thiamine phosphate synthase n=1 Tax=Sphingomonas sp. 1P06PA TaxID=554121 RepID=UPI0039A5BDC4